VYGRIRRILHNIVLIIVDLLVILGDYILWVILSNWQNIIGAMSIIGFIVLAFLVWSVESYWLCDIMKDPVLQASYEPTLSEYLRAHVLVMLNEC
jgi:hypothetical protein